MIINQGNACLIPGECSCNVTHKRPWLGGGSDMGCLRSETLARERSAQLILVPIDFVLMICIIEISINTFY